MDHNIQLRDFQMVYTHSGSSPENPLPLLLIHGFPLNKAIWQPQFDGLSDAAELIAPDLRGHGQSRMEIHAGSDQMYTMQRFAADCHELIYRLGLDQPAVVCGLSMGGYVAQAYAQQFPEKTAALILVSTRSGADTPEKQAERVTGAKKAQELGAAAVAENMLPKMFSPATLRENHHLVEQIRGMMAETSVEGIVAALLAMKDRPDYTSFLEETSLPVLIIHGEDDQLIPSSQAEAMKQAAPHAELKLIPGAGHLVNMEKPEEFNQAVRAFLQKVSMP